MFKPRRQAEIDAASFEAVVLPHLDSAHNLARWLVRDASLAEDVVQDSVVRALSYFGSFRGGDSRAWLMQIVRNVAYGMLAARKTHPESIVAFDANMLDIADPADDPEAALAQHQGRQCVERALAALPLELRECLVLRELEELSYKAIAEITGVPIGTVMSRLWRARQVLSDGADQGKHR